VRLVADALGEPKQGEGDNYLHLPAIVEAAASTPNAAKAAAAQIHKYLSKQSKPHGWTQYNAVMLMRILTDNPGHTFAQNIDAKFVATIKGLLREGRNTSTQHILRETLDSFEEQKAWDEDLATLLKMWREERGRLATPAVSLRFNSRQWVLALLLFC
jgi:hypothetical protein